MRLLASPRVVAGVFVGGAARRMQGRAKGLLAAPEGGTLVDRCYGVLRAAGISDIVLVGTHRAYASLDLDAIDDRPAGIGPLGGLLGLLDYAGESESLAVACDMPFVSEALLRKLLGAPSAIAVAPRRGDRWEPLCARYDRRMQPFAERRVAAGDHSLQRLLDEAGAIELPLEEHEVAELDDWDTPDDVTARRGGKTAKAPTR